MYALRSFRTVSLKASNLPSNIRPSTLLPSKCRRNTSNYTGVDSAAVDSTWPVLEKRDSRPPGSLINRNCIITGGTSGIGYSIAKRLVLEGASSVRLVSRSRTRGEEAIANIKRQTGIPDAPLSLIEGDLLEVKYIDNQWARFNQQNRDNPSVQINTLINCAGVSQNALLQRISDEEISSILKSNLEAPIILSRRFLKGYMALCAYLKRHKIAVKSEHNAIGETEASAQPFPSFVVLNISSLLAQKSSLGTSVYAASKAGLTSLTHSLVLEGSSIHSGLSPFAPLFRANTILPGYIDTRMTNGFSTDHKIKLTADTPATRFGTTEEVASAALLTLTNEYINGVDLKVDGGLGVV